MSPDGSNQTRLTSNNFNDGGAVWSHEAKSIAFHTNRVGGYPQIFLMNADGSDQRLLADAGVMIWVNSLVPHFQAGLQTGTVSVSAAGPDQRRSLLSMWPAERSQG